MNSRSTALRVPGPLDALRRYLPHGVLAGLSIALLSLAHVGSPRYQHLMQEDGWVEWATFMAFFLAGVLALSKGLRPAAGPWLSRLALAGIGVFCLFVAGEEISWGQRLLGYRPPDFFLEKNYQQEANLHNLLKNILDTRWMVFGIAVVYGVATPLLARVSRFPRVLAAPLALAPWFAVVAWLEYSYPYTLVGEFAELLLGLLFFFDVAERLHSAPLHPERLHSARLASARLVTRGYAAALLGAVAIVPLNDALLRWQGKDAVEEARAALTALAALSQQEAGLTPRLFKKRHIHKRVYTALQAGYLAWDPERFYLDPWQQPYWVVFRRNKAGTGGHLLLYSFGPNRRRDTQVRGFRRKGFQFEGDDIGVAVEVGAAAHARLGQSHRRLERP